MAEEKAKAQKITTVKATKETVKPVAKVAPAEKKVVEATETKKSTLSIDMVDLDGKASGKLTLPVEIFGEAVNQQLLAQAVRVYRANKRQGNASTKTRGEVDGSTRKIYRQKGTGRARHGSLRAPIFVKGGIVFGPRPHDFGLEMPKKMRRKALLSALSAKFADGQIIVLSDITKLEPKTKQLVSVLANIKIAEEKRRMLFVTDTERDNVKRAASNLQGVTVSIATRLNAYDVLNTKQLVLTKDTVEAMKKAFIVKE